MRHLVRSRSLIALLSAAALGACAKEQPAADTTRADSAGAAGASAQKLGETTGFDTPESVKYDAELDVFYVTNINGNPSNKDNNGYIARVRADSVGVMTRLVEGGQNGATLNAPKGMALRGDTLFVADIDAVRMFNRRTGASIGAVTLTAQNATFLNDVAAGPDGIYVTDTGIRFDAQGNMTHPGVNRIFRIAGRTVTEVAKGDSLGNPNGIAWDPAGNRFILAPFGMPALQSWTSGAATPTALVTGPGGYDGVEVLANGNILVSSWTDSTVHVVHGGSHMMPLIRNVNAPADIGVDTKRNVVAIPLFNGGKVEYYKIP
jgi:sugar lactone lactonase YvrE